jgi:hypothetical protein
MTTWYFGIVSATDLKQRKPKKSYVKMVALTHVKMASRSYMYRYVRMACRIYDEVARQTQLETVHRNYDEKPSWTHIEPHV